MGNEYNYEGGQPGTDKWSNWAGGGNYFEVGEDSGGQNGAIRVQNVTIAKNTTVVSATLIIKVGSKGAGSGDLKYKCWGIDEDNTSAFTGDPLGRTKTTAVTTAQASLPPVGENIGINVTSQVNEILSRGGWASGNAMGFIVENNGSPSNVWIFNMSSVAYLEVVVVSRPNFYPSPTTATAPSNPAKSNSFGIKVAKDGYDARTATDAQLAFSSSFPILKSLVFGQETVQAGVTKIIDHLLDYKGAFLVFAQEDLGGGNFGPVYRVPFLLYSSTYDTSIVESYIDNANLNIGTRGFVQGATSPPLRIYFYVFIDEIDL